VLVIPLTCLSTDGDRTFPMATAQTWNSLPAQPCYLVTFAAFIQMSVEDRTGHSKHPWLTNTASDIYSVFPLTWKVSKNQGINLVRDTHGKSENFVNGQAK